MTHSARSELLDETIIEEINRLLHMASDLCMAYATACRRIDDPRLREDLDLLDHSHDRYRAELGDWIRSHGGKETGTGDWHGVVERARVVIGDISGDGGILRAMATNEADMAAAYRRLRETPGIPEEVLAIVDRALEHEQRLRVFYEQAVARVSPIA